jgi:hypothetical protein
MSSGLARERHYFQQDTLSRAVLIVQAIDSKRLVWFRNIPINCHVPSSFREGQFHTV